MPNYHVIAFAYGYVESNSSAWLIMTAMNAEVVFKTPKAAVESLAAEMWIKYQHDKGLQGYYAKTCCKNVESSDKFCRVCGKSTKKETFNRGNFETFITDLFTSDNDSYGADCHFKGDYDTPDNAQWCPAGWPTSATLKNSKGVITICQNGEKILAEALNPVITGMHDKDRKWFLREFK